MKLTTGLTLLTLCLASANAFGGAIINGDFSSCDYSGWQKDTDGFGDVSLGNDFGMVNNGGNCSASINVDHFDPAGDFTGTAIDEAWFANTLFQELDFSGAADSTFSLEIDFAVDSEINSNDLGFIADYFLIGLNDGAGNYYDQTGGLGFLYAPAEIDGAFSQVLTFELDNSFVNQVGWFLDFQLNLGVDDLGFTDAFGSTLLLNSVSLTENKILSDVPEPAALSLLSLGLLGLYVRKKRS
ncbi:PEP-CTERM sorting domain-containing protein [uncultured Paraglaciecola sp.]|uniref:PEP-CTERM sorting domain-containing protein n=1 Tax=uncultured Paraglaciecola sp. TaxID=1765024 RepID=UPI0030DA5C71|tara:strand:- start:2400 stop:3122 length:723 start_codon:yes stop_codon:yes gene_type:complete